MFKFPVALATASVLAGPSYALAAPDETKTTSSSTAGPGRAYVELQALESETTLERVLVTGRRPTTAASASVVRSRDFLLRPRSRPADILEVTPGLEVVQHAGGGKANQYFIRGFDADHGTDLALSVDGVPINMVSHGHGQGYADLHFVIPEIVDRIEVEKGPYFAQLGDFATAGAVNLVTKKEVEHNSISLSGDMFETYRAVTAISPRLGNRANLIAAEVYGTNGPFISGEDLLRYNAFARSVFNLGGGELALTLTSYGAKWNASGQIPSREVDANRLDRFGAIDPTEGGHSSRQNAYASYERSTGDGLLRVTAYVAKYQLQLFSNFTFYSRDPVNGDMIEQTDDRILAGGEASYTLLSEWAGFEFATTLGLQTRNDFIDNGLHYSPKRVRNTSVATAEIFESSLSAYAKEETTWTRWLRSEIGLRFDFFNFDVVSESADASRQAALVSPKLNLIFSPGRRTELFVNFGLGFHSNDARGVVRATDPVTPLTRAVGYEVGARTRLFDRLDLASAIFLMDLQSASIFVGAEGTTEASGRTRRLGLEVEARLRLSRWLYADADFTLTRARYRDLPEGEDEIPLAPRLTVSAGLSAIHHRGYFGRLSLFHLAARPATEDGFVTARGYNRLDASLGYRTQDVEVSLSIQNLLDADVREAQFATVSRLPNETSPGRCPRGTRGVTDGGTFVGCEDLDFTPGWPLNAQVSLTAFF